MPRIKKDKVPLPNLSALPDAEEYLEVHIDEADEGKNPSSKSRMPYKGECVPLNSLDFRTNNIICLLIFREKNCPFKKLFLHLLIALRISHLTDNIIFKIILSFSSATSVLPTLDVLNCDQVFF